MPHTGSQSEARSSLSRDGGLDAFSCDAGGAPCRAPQHGECERAKAANVVVSRSRVARERSAGNTCRGLGTPPHEKGCRSFQVAIVSRTSGWVLGEAISVSDCFHSKRSAALRALAYPVNTVT